MEIERNTGNNFGAGIPAERLITAVVASNKSGVPFYKILELIHAGEILSCTYDAKHWISPVAVDLLKELKKQEKIQKLEVATE